MQRKKILFLPNWNIKKLEKKPEDMEPSNYMINGQKYWFFKYFKDDVDLDIIDIGVNGKKENFERHFLHCHVHQFLKAKKVLKKYDIVICHGFPSAMLLCLYKRIFCKKIKIVLFDIGSFCTAQEGGIKLKLSQFASKSLDYVIYHSSAQKKYYAKYFSWIISKSKFIKFGINDDFYYPLHLKKEKTILCVGASFRDWNTLIKAYIKVDNFEYKIRLIGPSIEEFNKYSFVEQLGKVSAEKLREEIDRCTFCVLPLVSINYSYAQMSLLDSMMMGKCVLIADVPPLRDYGEDLKSYIRYKPEDIDDCSEKLKMIMDNNKLVDDVSVEAREYALSWKEKDMALAIEETINKVIGK